MKPRVHALWIVSMLICLAFASSAGAEVMNWTIGGVQREAIVLAPAKKTSSGKAPLLFAFHGHGDNMEDFAGGIAIQKFWPEAIVVYPQGLPTNPAVDPDGFGWVYKTGEDGQRDLKFFDAMLETMHTKFAVDDQRIYATGFSNGGMFTYVLWGTRAKLFAAFAIVAGRIVPEIQLTEPKPALHIAGENDATVPFKVQQDAMRVVREVDGADKQGSSCGQNCTLYPSSKGAPVMIYIHSGGHVYPDNASEMIVKFFEEHSLGPEAVTGHKAGQ
jgi:polyhydroxybutyrate depolymerase